MLDGVLAGEEVDVEEIVTLLGARGADFTRVTHVADGLRSEAVGDTVTFVRNRNINYTNICTFKCKFCAFSKGPLSLNLRGDPYLLGLDELQRRVVEAVEHGATEVCLQGGIHPDFDGNYYLEVARAAKAVAPDIHVHGFTALEVTEGARRLGMPLRDYLILAKEAGLSTLPGTAAEILDDEVRAVICPDKVNTEEWLEAHRTAHSVGLRSNITIMFGTVERPVHVARHMVRTRALQKETGGFTEFVPLPFVHMATPIFLQRRARMGPTMREVILMHSVGRIAYRGWIDNIQVSWVKAGIEGARQALLAGCNDLGGTLMDENISRCGRRVARPGARRRRAARDRRAARAHARAAHHAVRPGHHRRQPPAAAARADRGRPRRRGRRRGPRQHRAHAHAGSVSRRSYAGPVSEESPVASQRLDVVGIGNALVDVLSHESDDFVDEARSRAGRDDADRHRPGRDAVRGDGPRPRGLGRLGRELDGRRRVVRRQRGVRRPGQRRPARRGVRARHPRRRRGVHDRARAGPSAGGAPTGRCLIVVTPDAQRTLNTFLGASAQLGPADLDHDLIARAQVLFLEGYLWDEPEAKDAFRQAARVAHDAGNRVAFTLSDGFCVDRHRDEFLDLVEHDVDVLFANEVEITSLYEVDSFDDALQRVQHHCEIAALDPEREGRGDRGARRDPRRRRASGRRQLVDTTGAGDLFAAGLPLRPHARLRPRHRGPARRVRRGRGHQPPRRPPGAVAARAGAATARRLIR